MQVGGYQVSGTDRRDIAPDPCEAELISLSALAAEMPKAGVDRSETEEIAIHYAVAELLRKRWHIGRPPSHRSKGYDLIAARPRKRVVFVEVKGLQSDGQFIFNGDEWYDPKAEVVADVVIGVRARPERPVEFYVGLAKEVQTDLEARENSEWAPWRQEKKYRDRWDKLENLTEGTNR